MYMTDEEGLARARKASDRSSDPSTKTGCVVVDDETYGVGWNGFPRVAMETPDRLSDRPTRLALTVHAEVRALLTAEGLGIGFHAYVWPWPPCAACAGALVVAGVARVVAPRPTPAQEERWGDSFRWMETIFAEAGIELVLVDSVE